MCCEGIKIVCYLEYSISDSPHTVPAEITTVTSDVGTNPEQNLQPGGVSTVLGIFLHAAAY